MFGILGTGTRPQVALLQSVAHNTLLCATELTPLRGLVFSSQTSLLGIPIGNLHLSSSHTFFNLSFLSSHAATGNLIQAIKLAKDDAASAVKAEVEPIKADQVKSNETLQKHSTKLEVADVQIAAIKERTRRVEADANINHQELLRQFMSLRDGINSRFDSMGSRIDSLNNLMLGGFGLVLTALGLSVGLLATREGRIVPTTANSATKSSDKPDTQTLPTA